MGSESPALFDSLEMCRASFGRQFVEAAKDPRCANYDRKIVRPTVEWGGMLLSVLRFDFANLLIQFVRVYQRYAPERIRRRCRFEPSCSQYMILAVQKHGFLKGLRLGCNRIARCSSGDGGFECP